MTDIERRLAEELPAAAFDREAFAVALAARAADAGMVDVAYASVDSPLGRLTVFVSPRGLLRVQYQDEPLDATLQEVADRISPRVLEAPRRTDEVRHELDDYFEGRRRDFSVPVDWRLVRGFATAVLRATAAVPFGALSTYRDVAAAAGSPNAYRAAGNALGSNPVPIVVPCHRIVHADGSLGGYTGGLARKEYLLELEGSLLARR